MSANGLHFGDGFMQFGDGPQIPIKAGSIQWGPTKRAPSHEEFHLAQLHEMKLPLPPEAAARICRAVDMPEMADRIEVEHHPDLAELDLQLRGYYDGQ